MSNPFAALQDSDDEDDTRRTKKSGVEVEDEQAEDDQATRMDDLPSTAPPAPVLSRKAQKKQAKKVKRQRREELTEELCAIARADFQRNGGADVPDDEEAAPPDDHHPSEVDEEAADDDDADETDSKQQDGFDPASVNLHTADILATTRTLLLLDKHSELLEHAALRSLRQALAPLVSRLSVKWHGLAANSSMRRVLKQSKNQSIRESARVEYELALDASARNATAIRAARLKKLETLNTVVDGDAAGEAARARLLRVPDGVAITDGRSDDVSMKMLGDGRRQQLLLTNGTEAGASAATNAAAASIAAPPPAVATKLNHPIKCYICKTPYKELHHFYDSLCPACAKLNWSKRELHVDMTDKIVLLTGARVKIGYRILVKLLRCGAFVVATTRFPHDLSVRLRLEHDFDQWRAHVHIYGLDFRNLTVLEHFVQLMYKKYTHLDAIINNACQTVRRPPAYYTHLIAAERLNFEDLSTDAQAMLGHHHAFAAQSAQLRLGDAIDAAGGMNRIQSGSSVDIDVPPARPMGGSKSTVTIEEADAEMPAAGEEEIIAPPRRNPTMARAASEPSGSAKGAAATASVAAPVAAAAAPPASRKRSRRETMRAAETSTAASSQVSLFAPPSAADGGHFTSPSALAAESTQLTIAGTDEYTEEERQLLFPAGERDVNGQQLDLREKNSWTMRLEDVPIGEAAEVTAINYLAPFLLNSKLRGLMVAGNEKKTLPRFIVNVSAMEGKFYRFKSSNHPHTNAAKAALNMMTRTSAQDYVSSMIFMTAVDTGWINDENPLPKAARIAQKFNFQTPLDEIDAAMRVLDPILTPLAQYEKQKVKNVKELKIPFGYFIKDYVKCEW